MKQLTILGLLFLSVSVFAQNNDLLKTLPTTKEDFIASEKQLLNTVNWLETTPVNEQTIMRTKQMALLLGWLTNSPTVTITVNANTMPPTKKNPETLIVFMGGWARYAIQNNYTQDEAGGATAGLTSVIKMYKAGMGLKKDKELDKLVAIYDKGGLETWVKEQLKKK